MKIKENFFTNQNSLVKRVKAQGRKRIPSKVLQSLYTEILCKTKGKSICETLGIQSHIEKSGEYMLSEEEMNAITTLKAQNKIKDETFGPLCVERRSLESLLNPMKLVNDEVISKYTELMAIRENIGGHNLLKCHFFNAWFHKFVCTTRIIAKGNKKIEDIYYDGNDVKIKCIIRKIPYDLKSKEKIMIPLNEMSHWYLLVIDLKRKIFSIYNSLKGHQTSTYINTMVSRLKIHLLKNCEIECDGFTVSIGQECPQQPNSVDCGVYLMKFMECLSRGDIFDFNSGPMNFERKKLVAQLMLGKMITPQ
ncbi:ubiquitin-like-specific protease 1A [Magnolia sinica]|uniref:ubiquitin-like-specific protease 1A n=1 Tax=Magnolia sinica TaxID=86752 RepID=UPI00265865D2|nr:ubiquitin-like-specific protease 1A [Magnolia sinica]